MDGKSAEKQKGSRIGDTKTSQRVQVRGNAVNRRNSLHSVKLNLQFPIPTLDDFLSSTPGEMRKAREAWVSGIWTNNIRHSREQSWNAKMKTKGLKEGSHTKEWDSSQPLCLQVPECQQPDFYCPDWRPEDLPLEEWAAQVKKIYNHWHTEVTDQNGNLPPD